MASNTAPHARMPVALQGSPTRNRKGRAELGVAHADIGSPIWRPPPATTGLWLRNERSSAVSGRHRLRKHCRPPGGVERDHILVHYSYLPILLYVRLCAELRITQSLLYSDTLLYEYTSIHYTVHIFMDFMQHKNIIEIMVPIAANSIYVRTVHTYNALCSAVHDTSNFNHSVNMFYIKYTV